MKNDAKIDQESTKRGLGTLRAANVQHATRQSAKCVRPVKFLMPFFKIWIIFGAILGPAGVQRASKINNFGIKSQQNAKMRSKRGFQKKHDVLMEI